MATTDVTGQSPLSFTDANGAQRFVPLSAFEFSGSKVQLKTAWASEFTGAEQTIMLAVATARAAAGELTPPPVRPPSPALLFTAAFDGAEGNNVVVTVTPDAGNVLTAKALIDVTETDTYPGLTDAAAAKAALGVDNPAADETAGTGLVTLKKSGAMKTGVLPKAQTVTAKGAGADVVAPGQNGDKLFTLVLGPRGPSAGVPVTITPDTASGTFTLEAVYAVGNTTKVALSPLGALPAAVTAVISVSAPPGGVAVPAAGDVQLSGGADGVAASGTAYTS